MMRFFLMLFLSVIILMSCITERHFLSDDDLVWMSPYECGDTILFKSSNDMDSLVISEKCISNDFEFIAHEIGVYESYGTAWFDGKMIHYGDSLDIMFFVQRPSKSYLNFIYRFSERSKSCFIDDGKRLETKSVNGKKNKDIVLIDSALLEWDKYVFSPYNVKYLIWSKSKGLLQYEYLSTDSTKGGVYTFYKKLPYRKL